MTLPNLLDLPRWAERPLLILVAVAAVLIAHAVAGAVLVRAARRTPTVADDILLRRLRAPSRWLLVAFTLSALQPLLHLHAEGRLIWRQVAGLVTPGLFGWLVVALMAAAREIVEHRADVTVADNLRARRRRTRANILYRIAVFVMVVVTFCLMLMSIPSIRAVGVTLIASAGVAALAVGAAAQPALKNLIAGLQMAFTEPIRLDDVVVIEGEWGRIEEMRLTYVVVRIWDDRRLVVPVSRFLEGSFQNWTRETSQLLGSCLFYLDPAADIAALRTHLEQVVRANPRWDGRFFNLQVTDMKADAIEVRALVTARDAATAFDLRCDVREAMLKHIRETMPHALPRTRGDVTVQGAGSPPG